MGDIDHHRRRLPPVGKLKLVVDLLIRRNSIGNDLGNNRVPTVVNGERYRCWRADVVHGKVTGQISGIRACINDNVCRLLRRDTRHADASALG
jgi:hypothetical protein